MSAEVLNLAPVLVIAALGAACDDGASDEGGPRSCGPCNDGQPCTDDLCDTLTGECLFVPRAVDQACRTDAHCEDGEACTDDVCAIDDCGLQRCTHPIAATCVRCVEDDECVDDDACTRDDCELGTSDAPGSAFTRFCRHTPYPGCEPRCKSSYEPLPDEAWAVGRIWPAPCDTCPCATRPELVTSFEADPPAPRIRFAGEEFACATRGCEFRDPWWCTPLSWDRRYVVWGRWVDEAVMVPSGWCLSGTWESEPGIYDGRMSEDGGGTLLFVAEVSELGMPNGFAFDPVGCERACGGLVEVPAQWRTLLTEEHLRGVVGFTATDQHGAERVIIATMFQDATGWSGRFTSRDDLTTPDDVPIEGTIQLVLRPDDAQ